MSQKKDDFNDTIPDDDRIDVLFKLQSDCIERALKALINFGKDSVDRKKNRVYYTTRMKSFGQIIKEFETNHREIVTLVPTADRSETPYFKEDTATLFEDHQLEFITTVQNEYELKFPDGPPQPEHKEENLSSNVTLPPISIPRFTGAPTDWKAFHDIFKSIVHSNTKLPGSHKIQYLNSVFCGEAKDIISGFELSDDDYPKAWKALCDVYNDKPSMFMHIMNKFAALEPLAKEQPEPLRELIKATASCMKSLDGVGVDSDKVDSVVTYFLIRKLPPSTVAYWEETRDRGALPSFSAVKQCIETRIRVSAAISNVQWEGKRSSSSLNEVRSENKPQSYQTKVQSTKGKRVSTYHATTKVYSAPRTTSSSQHIETTRTQI